MGEYSPTPKPRRGHRRASGGGALAKDEPRIAGVNAPLHAHTPTPARKETSGKSAANRGNLRHARGSAQEHLTKTPALGLMPQYGAGTILRVTTLLETSLS